MNEWMNDFNKKMIKTSEISILGKKERHRRGAPRRGKNVKRMLKESKLCGSRGVAVLGRPSVYDPQEFISRQFQRRVAIN